MTIGCLAYKPQITYGSKKGILRPYDHCVPFLKGPYGPRAIGSLHPMAILTLKRTTFMCVPHCLNAPQKNCLWAWDVLYPKE